MTVDPALRDLYGSAYGRLVAVVTLAVGDQAEAEDLVQEGFARLLPRWERIRHYDDPEAWVRRVALRLAMNRRRKLRNRTAAYRLHGAPQVAAATAGEAVDVQRALAALSVPQRQVVVLHHLLGFGVAQVAHELGVPVGTVKSRLARSRAVLAPLLEEGVVADV